MAATAEPRRDLTGGDAACAAAALLAADAAWRRSPSASADLVLDAVRVRLRVAGDAVAGVVLPPLARVSEPPRGAPVAVLTAFDGAGSGERPAPPSGAPGRRSADAGVHLGFEPDAPLLSVYDPASASGAFWAEDAAALPQWHTASPLRDLLRWVLRGHGLHFVHGAVVGDERGGVLLAGPSRSGKSTTAMLCAAHGMRHLSDDYALLSLRDRPVAHALFATAKLDDRALEMLGMEAPPAPAGDKIVLDPAASAPGGVTGSLPLRALLLPRVGERTGALEPVSPGAALAALAPSTLIQLAGSRAEDLASLAGLARTLPAYRLAVGPDLDAVLARVGEALEA
jgi:hypothetical protein